MLVLEIWTSKRLNQQQSWYQTLRPQHAARKQMSKAIQMIYYLNFLTNEDLALDHSTASDGHRGLQTATQWWLAQQTWHQRVLKGPTRLWWWCWNLKFSSPTNSSIRINMETNQQEMASHMSFLATPLETQVTTNDIVRDSWRACKERGINTNID